MLTLEILRFAQNDRGKNLGWMVD